MTTSTEIQNTDYIKKDTILKMNPKKFALWLFIVSIIMIFASLTSAYIVKKSEAEWLIIEIPFLFFYSTLIVVISSVSVQIAYFYLLKKKKNKTIVFLCTTIFLGMFFICMQWLGWIQLVSYNIYFVGNPAGSFIYVLSGLHGMHLIGGIIFLIIVLFLILQKEKYFQDALWMQLCVTFWHFLTFLWVYLYFFLILNN
ncbi:MAG: cytochrome c oxidase subunit 3 [Chitinophagaceae bacterium]|nr:cytochrome c oxidase subunit 3 [Chitinophagaceae bacterium]